MNKGNSPINSIVIIFSRNFNDYDKHKSRVHSIIFSYKLDRKMVYSLS